MKSRLVASMLLWFTLSAIVAFGQQNPLRGPEQPPAGAGEPDQPVRPQAPILRPRTAPPGGQQPGGQYPPGQQPGQPIQQRPPQPPPPPFRLTPQEEAQVDRVLNLWEQRNRDIKKFDCKFKRWIYDAVFGVEMAR